MSLQFSMRHFHKIWFFGLHFSKKYKRSVCLSREKIVIIPPFPSLIVNCRSVLLQTVKIVTSYLHVHSQISFIHLTVLWNFLTRINKFCIISRAVLSSPSDKCWSTTSITIWKTKISLILWCLTPFSTIFQLYRGGLFWWRKPVYPDKITDL